MKPDATEFPLCEKAYSYAEKAVSGDVLIGRYAKLACKRFLADLAIAGTEDFPYRWDCAVAERMMRFAQKLPHVKGKWVRKKQRFKLEPWQCFVFANLYGWVHTGQGNAEEGHGPDRKGLRRFNRGHIYIPRKNGKTPMGAISGWWMLAKDGEPGSEVYCGATTEDQAMEVFRAAYQMGIAEPALPKGTGVRLFKTSLTKEDGSVFKPVVGKPGDGASVHCAIVDEFHEHPDSTLYDTMRTGVMAREQPLLLVISTAGYLLQGPCRADWRECENLLEGAIKDDTKFAIIFAVDDPSEWSTVEGLRKANPNWGVSVEIPQILSLLEEAKRDPAKQAIFKTKHCNMWVNSSNGWINMERWNSCASPELRIEDFIGQDCWIGIDAASRVDVFSMVIIFKRGNQYIVFAKHFLPEETVYLEHNQHFRKWAEAGHLVATPGARTDQHLVEEQLKKWADMFNIREVAYDAREISMLMDDVRLWAGFPCIEMNQGPTLMSEPMKELEAIINTGDLRHPACPMLTWMAANVVRKQARGGGPTKLYYPTKERNDDKIDGIVAMIMALSRAKIAQGGAGGGFF